jgi:hypothetical protein
MMNDTTTFRYVTSTITATPEGFHDIAVLVFAEPLFSDYVSLDGVGSFAAYSQTDDPLLIAGYGARTVTATGSGLGLRSVPGLPIGDALCDAMMPSYAAAGEWACMAQLGGGACYGDSGGPVLWRSGGQSPNVLLGVNSIVPWALTPERGINCATVPFLLVYKVAAWTSWINSVIGRTNTPLAVVASNAPPLPPMAPSCAC